jgi:hypothetical protein
MLNVKRREFQTSSVGISGLCHNILTRLCNFLCAKALCVGLPYSWTLGLEASREESELNNYADYWIRDATWFFTQNSLFLKWCYWKLHHFPSFCNKRAACVFRYRPLIHLSLCLNLMFIMITGLTAKNRFPAGIFLFSTRSPNHSYRRLFSQE